MNIVNQKSKELKDLIDKFAKENDVDVVAYVAVSKAKLDVDVFRVIKAANPNIAVFCNNELGKVINQTTEFILSSQVPTKTDYLVN